MSMDLRQIKLDYYNNLTTQLSELYEMLTEYQKILVFEINPLAKKKNEYESDKTLLNIAKKESELTRAKADVERIAADIELYQLSNLRLYIGDDERKKLPPKPADTIDVPFNADAYGPIQAKKSELESLVSARAQYTDPMMFLEGMKTRVLGVGRVEANTKPIGTAILVGKNTVLTNWHVVRKSITDETPRDPKTLEVRFGHYMTSKTTLEPGVAFKVSELLGWKGADSLDYALLKLEEDPSADDKFKIIPLSTTEPNDNSIVNILHHPMGQPMKLSYQDNWVKMVKGDRVLYMTNTEPGSSGSPVFNDDWELVALHHSGTPSPATNFKEKINANEGIIMNYILEDLDKSNLIEHVETV